MSREIKRVPLDFDCPLDKGYTDFMVAQHEKSCKRRNHDKCEIPISPPEGPGWQLWQGVSDGPISPVFDTAEKLLDWMSQPVPADQRPPYDPSPFPDYPWAQGWHRETARALVNVGWLPSGVVIEGRMLPASEAMAELEADLAAPSSPDEPPA